MAIVIYFLDLDHVEASKFFVIYDKAVIPSFGGSETGRGSGSDDAMVMVLLEC